MSYEEMKELVKNKQLPLMGENKVGESVIVSEGKDEEGHYYQTETAQYNGWLRVNTYYETGTVTETFDR